MRSSRLARLSEIVQLGSPDALAGVKALLRPQDDSLRTEFGRMQELTAGFFASPDAREGMAAFADKRQPAWVSDRTAECSSQSK